MADALKEVAPEHQSLKQLAEASAQLSDVKDKLERQQQEDAEKLRKEQDGEFIYFTGWSVLIRLPIV